MKLQMEFFGVQFFALKFLSFCTEKVDYIPFIQNVNRTMTNKSANRSVENWENGIIQVHSDFNRIDDHSRAMWKK